MVDRVCVPMTGDPLLLSMVEIRLDRIAFMPIVILLVS